MTDLDGGRAFEIAARARRYALLAERPELLYPDAEHRAERVIADDTRSQLDVLLLAGVDDLDRVCAAAVAKLNHDKAEPVLDLLGVLPADYLLAIYFALPSDQRGQCCSDQVWAYHLRRIPDGVDEATGTLRQLAELERPEDEADRLLSPEESVAFRGFSEDLTRAALGMAGHHGD